MHPLSALFVTSMVLCPTVTIAATTMVMSATMNLSWWGVRALLGMGKRAITSYTSSSYVEVDKTKEDP